MIPPPLGGLIRISKDEALDTHVDDMLRRQMSLRGDPGVTRDRGRKWYYQNWIIFMLLGLLGAAAAWALLEPVFDDMLYFQGPITKVDFEESLLPSELQQSAAARELAFLPRGSITVNGEKIFLVRGLREILPDGTQKRLVTETLKEGETVGLYLEYTQAPEVDLAFAHYIIRNPPAQSPERAKMTLAQLQARTGAAGLVLFATVAGLVGLFVGAGDGLVCRLPRRALLCGTVGLLVGFVGGFVSSLFANIAYAPLSDLAQRQSGEDGLTTFGFVIQLIGRSLAWALAGLAMGLGQGIALRSKRLLLYGLLGGVVGGLLGGLLFDPIDIILLGTDKPSAHWSRLIGFMVIGASVGGMIGVVELLARDAWLRMTQGPLAGKEFLIFKDVMNVGSSPRSDIYLFKDPLVSENHAVIRALGDSCEIEARQPNQPILLNNRSVTRARLRHGDTVTIGRTMFVFQQRKS